MKRRVLFLIASLALAACQRGRTEPADSYRIWTDRMIVRLGLPAVGIRPCPSHTEVIGGEKVDVGARIDECFKMQPPQRWHGIWRLGPGEHDEQFCPGSTDACSLDQKPHYWLSWRHGVREPDDTEWPRRYEVDFIGRRTTYPGEFSFFQHGYDIVVDQVISLKKLEPKMSEEAVKAIRAEAPGMTDACAEMLRVGGIPAVPQEADRCFAFDPPRKWKGIWVNAFEGSQFCLSAAARNCGGDVDNTDIWLDFASRPSVQEKITPGGVYDVEFIGRRSRGAGFFGHFGMFRNDIIVDRMISMKELQKPYEK